MTMATTFVVNKPEVFWIAGLEGQGGVPQAGSCVTLPVEETSPICYWMPPCAIVHSSDNSNCSSRYMQIYLA